MNEVLILLMLGFLFLILGFILILGQRYCIKSVNNKRIVEEIEINEDNVIVKYRTLLGVFSVVLGVLCIVSYIIY